jgi:hypothetical protein
VVLCIASRSFGDAIDLVMATVYRTSTNGDVGFLRTVHWQPLPNRKSKVLFKTAASVNGWTATISRRK